MEAYQALAPASLPQADFQTGKNALCGPRPALSITKWFSGDGRFSLSFNHRHQAPNPYRKDKLQIDELGLKQSFVYYAVKITQKYL